MRVIVKHAFQVFLIAVLGIGALRLTSATSAEEFYIPSVNNFGGVGLMMTRTARFGADGEFAIGFSEIDPYRRYFITVQALPWLEATFRYSDLTKIPLGGDTFKDRGADLKFKLLNEQKYIPAVALGLQDGIGTGLFDGEYVVASKRYMDLDLSLGIGWGYLGTRGDIKNPLSLVTTYFDNRDANSGRGGKFNPANYFSGKRASLFGGVEYFTPIDGLTLKVEYEGNDYSDEPRSEFGNKVAVATSPINFGINYRPFSWLDIAAGRERGYEGVVRMAMRANFHTSKTPKFDVPPVPIKPRMVVKQKAVQDSRPAIEDTSSTLNDDFAIIGLNVDSVELTDRHVSVRVSGVIDGVPDAELMRAAHSASNAFSDAVSSVTIIGSDSLDGMDTASYTASELTQFQIVDYLFDDLDKYGVEAVELSHTEAQVYLKSSLSQVEQEQAALAVVRVAPTPLERVTFVTISDDQVFDSLTISRKEIARASLVNQMFDGLEEMGFSVEAVDVSEDAATVTVMSKTNVSAEVYRRAAWIVADSVVTSVEEVTLIGLENGREIERITVLASSDSYVGVNSGSGVLDVSSIESADDIFDELAQQGAEVDALHFTPTRATVFVTPTRFREAARNIGRPARVIANSAPATVEQISIVTMADGMPINHVTLMRRDLERAASREGSAEELWKQAEMNGGAEVPQNAVVPEQRYPSFNWSLTPNTRQYIHDEAQFLLYQLFARLNGTLEYSRGLSFEGTLFANLYNNFEKASTDSNSLLPRVRSEIVKYLQGTDNKILRLTANYRFSPKTDVYTRVSGGIYEEMFGGIGAEVLYRPFGSRWAIGADVNRVKQRDFKGMFGFFDYEVTTGHANIHYQLPVYDMSAAMYLGQYLAGDRGASYFVWRNFDNGMTVGGWATLTNVPANVFGEGSFDKGFFIRIPFDVFLMKSTRKSGVFSFQPLSRDGGQILLGSKQLYELTRSGSLGELSRDWGLVLH